MQSEPLITEIALIIAKLSNIITNPTTDQVRLFLACSTLDISPPAVKNLIPEIIIKKEATTPANPSIKLIILPKKNGIQLKGVGVFWSKQSAAVITIELKAIPLDYQLRVAKARN